MSFISLSEVTSAELLGYFLVPSEYEKSVIT